MLLGFAIVMSSVLVTRLPTAARPPGAGWMFVVALTLGALSSAGTFLLISDRRERASLTTRVLIALYSSGVSSAGILATAANDSALALFGACVSSILLIAGCVSLVMDPRTALSEPQSRGDENSDDSHETAPSASPTFGLAGELVEADTPFPDSVDQSWRRWREGGLDILDGCIRASFEAGQSSTVLHIPLQPAMPSSPSVDCEPADSADIRITADPIMPFGVRLVCRRGGDVASPLDSMISIRISASAATSRAA
jgi:hypothetical protein